MLCLPITRKSSHKLECSISNKILEIDVIPDNCFFRFEQWLSKDKRIKLPYIPLIIDKYLQFDLLLDTIDVDIDVDDENTFAVLYKNTWFGNNSCEEAAVSVDANDKKIVSDWKKSYFKNLKHRVEKENIYGNNVLQKYNDKSYGSIEELMADSQFILNENNQQTANKNGTNSHNDMKNQRDPFFKKIFKKCLSFFKKKEKITPNFVYLKDSKAVSTHSIKDMIRSNDFFVYGKFPRKFKLTRKAGKVYFYHKKYIPLSSFLMVYKGYDNKKLEFELLKMIIFDFILLNKERRVDTIMVCLSKNKIKVKLKPDLWFRDNETFHSISLFNSNDTLYKNSFCDQKYFTDSEFGYIRNLKNDLPILYDIIIKKKINMFIDRHDADAFMRIRNTLFWKEIDVLFDLFYNKNNYKNKIKVHNKNEFEYCNDYSLGFYNKNNCKPFEKIISVIKGRLYKIKLNIDRDDFIFEMFDGKTKKVKKVFKNRIVYERVVDE